MTVGMVEQTGADSRKGKPQSPKSKTPKFQRLSRTVGLFSSRLSGLGLSEKSGNLEMGEEAGLECRIFRFTF